MPVLDILVEGMGHINFAQEIIDRKGITDRVTLAGMTLMNWQVFLLPLDDAWVAALARPARGAAGAGGRRRARASSSAARSALDAPADTFIDMTGYRKGVVWVNGHNLGRYWDIGPQKRLYCPASWLKAGENEVIVFDLHKTEASPLRGAGGAAGSIGERCRLKSPSDWIGLRRVVAHREARARRTWKRRRGRA